MNIDELLDIQDDQDSKDSEDHTCPHCCGTGGEPMDNYCTPCEHCDGEGYQSWLA